VDLFCFYLDVIVGWERLLICLWEWQFIEGGVKHRAREVVMVVGDKSHGDGDGVVLMVFCGRYDDMEFDVICGPWGRWRLVLLVGSHRNGFPERMCFSRNGNRREEKRDVCWRRDFCSSSLVFTSISPIFLVVFHFVFSMVVFPFQLNRCPFDKG